MTDKNPDLFGKIDAILEKRDALVLTDNVKINDDFPVLNEVIDDSAELCTANASELIAQSYPVSVFLERRLGERRRVAEVNETAESMNNNNESRLVGLEEKLVFVVQKHMDNLEKDLHRVIHDEMSNNTFL